MVFVRERGDWKKVAETILLDLAPLHARHPQCHTCHVRFEQRSHAPPRLCTPTPTLRERRRRTSLGGLLLLLLAACKVFLFFSFFLSLQCICIEHRSSPTPAPSLTPAPAPATPASARPPNYSAWAGRPSRNSALLLLPAVPPFLVVVVACRHKSQSRTRPWCRTGRRPSRGGQRAPCSRAAC